MSIRAKLRAQTLDDRVTFERKVASRTATGGMTENWYSLTTVHARVDGAKAKSSEPDIVSGIKTLRDYTIWIRAEIMKRYTLTPLDRVNWHDRLMSIIDIPDQGLKGQLIAVICSAGLNKG